MGARLAVAVVVWCTLGPTAARADERDGQAMARLVRELRYEEAIARGQRALREADPSDGAGLQSLYGLLGTAYFLVGDEAQARLAFLQLCALAPETQPASDAAPTLRAFFERLRVAAVEARVRPEVTREAGHVRVTVRPSAIVDSLVLAYRARASAFAQKRLERTSDGFSVVLPDLDRFEYWLLAIDPGGVPVAMAGTEQAPLVFEPSGAVAVAVPSAIPQNETHRPVAVAAADQLVTAKSPQRPLYRRWWLWTLVGVAAAGAAIGLGVGLTAQTKTQVDLCVRIDPTQCR